MLSGAQSDAPADGDQWACLPQRFGILRVPGIVSCWNWSGRRAVRRLLSCYNSLSGSDRPIQQPSECSVDRNVEDQQPLRKQMVRVFLGPKLLVSDFKQIFHKREVYDLRSGDARRVI